MVQSTGKKDPKTISKVNLRNFSLRSNIVHTNRFSDRSTLKGGGNFTLQFSDIKAAEKVLKQYYDSIDFWQVSKQFTVKREKSNIPTTGFSKPYFPQGGRTIGGKSYPPTPKARIGKALKEAMLDAGVNAINQQGYRFAYGKTPPQNVKEKRGWAGVFQLVIWFHGDDAQTFFPSE